MCVYILFKLNSVFLLVFAVFLTLTRNRMIVYFEAKQPTRVADKNIFSSDLPSCWITGTDRETECILKKKTKLEPNHSVGIIPSSLWILGPAHSVNAVWNTCTVQWHSEFSRRSEKHACSTILKCVAARVWYYFRDSPAPCFLITNIGRSLMLAGRLFRKPWMSWGRLSTCPLYPRWPPCLR